MPTVKCLSGGLPPAAAYIKLHTGRGHGYEEIRVKLAVCIAVLAMIMSNLASAQDVKPDDVIKFRKGAYQVINWEMRPLGLMVKGEIPFNKDVFAKKAALIDALSHVVPESFIAGTEKGETHANPEIWNDPAKFKAALERFQNEAGKMNEVAKGGNFDAI